MAVGCDRQERACVLGFSAVHSPSEAAQHCPVIVRDVFSQFSVCTFLPVVLSERKDWVWFKTMGEEANAIKFPCGRSQLCRMVCV